MNRQKRIGKLLKRIINNLPLHDVIAHQKAKIKRLN